MRPSVIFIALAFLVAFTAVAPSLGAGPFMYVADLVPLNGSGVSGMAELTVEDGMLMVTIHATGLEPNRNHPQHIHGFDLPRNATCPDMSADTDGDGLISVGEGLPFYGPVLLPLTPFSTTPTGALDYTATFTDLSALEPVSTLQNRTIVLHGRTVNSDYVASLPIACGQIRVAPRGRR
ncbi:MAG: hypothetical protein OEN01_02055 [Candidatus Krumholzibacteria bacterium]|nr:hypothetical protein [Candidatus Krumholzibacteria bacterium]